MKHLFVVGALVAFAGSARADFPDALEDAVQRQDLTAITEMLHRCGSPLAEDALEVIGPIKRVDPIGKRSVREALHITGQRARAYAFFASDRDQCTIVPVVGKPTGFAKGSFGHGAVLAYGLTKPKCHTAEDCPFTVVTVKTADDRLVDAIDLELDCEDGLDVDRVSVFTGHDSLKVSCWYSHGADPGRIDHLIELVDGKLAIVARVDAGNAWSEWDSDTHRRCTGRPDGGFMVASSGATPALAVSSTATEAECAAAHVERRAGSCERTVAIYRQVWDIKTHRFVAVGPPRVALVTGLCKCTTLVP
jgi:hypothetical protein